MGEFTDSSVVRASEEHLATELDGETVILHRETDTYYGLNGVGPGIWELLQEPRSIAELRDRLVEEYDVDADRCDRDLRELLDELDDNDLVERVDA